MRQTLAGIDEIFLPVIGFEGFYEISNYGRLLSLERYIPRYNGGFQFIAERIIKPDINSKKYLRNKMNKEAFITRFLVHRMVAEYFVPNPNTAEYDQINHIDGNKQNPYYKNLEWCNASMNHKHRFDVLGHIGGMTGKTGNMPWNKGLKLKQA